MIETVVTVELPVDEEIIIKKNRIIKNNNGKRICIVTGTHGDELEGQYVCYELNRRIKENINNLSGIVDIYPAINPLGIDSISRGIPMFDLDMNSIFPGDENGAMAENIAGRLIQDIKGANLCIDIHSSNIFLREVPQVRINELYSNQLLPYAKLLNTEFILVHESVTVLESTLAYSLNDLGVPTLVVEMGVGMRITKSYCDELVDGIIALMKNLDMWSGDIIKIKDPIISTTGKINIINAEVSGVFISHVKNWVKIKKGDHIGDIIDPLEGVNLQKVISPCDGKIFTLREYPIVYDGSLLARIFGGENK